MTEFAAVPTADDISGEAISHEARDWLVNNRNPFCFAGNRFGHKDYALDFVEQLHRAGALRVEVTNIYDEGSRIEQEGGPYADTFLVHLPPEPDRLAQLMTLCDDADELVVHGNVAELWWD